MCCMRFIDVLFRYAVHSSDDIGAPWTFFENNQQKWKFDLTPVNPLEKKTGCAKFYLFF